MYKKGRYFIDFSSIIVSLYADERFGFDGPSDWAQLGFSGVGGVTGGIRAMVRKVIIL